MKPSSFKDPSVSYGVSNCKSASLCRIVVHGQGFNALRSSAIPRTTRLAGFHGSNAKDLRCVESSETQWSSDSSNTHYNSPNTPQTLRVNSVVVQTHQT